MKGLISLALKQRHVQAVGYTMVGILGLMVGIEIGARPQRKKIQELRKRMRKTERIATEAIWSLEGWRVRIKDGEPN